MKELKIVATIVVKNQYRKEIISILHKIVDETRKEDGVVSYNLHQDIQNPLKYIILEVWKSQDSIDKHNQTDHFKEFLLSIDEKIESLTVDIIREVY